MDRDLVRTKNKPRKGVLILEHGIPHYRYFLFRHLVERLGSILIIHSGDKFHERHPFQSIRGANIRLPHRISLVFFNPLKLLFKDVIITTFNIRKPHTWLFVLLLPWKKWILWGQGYGRAKNIFLDCFKRIMAAIAQGYVTYSDVCKKYLVDIGVRPDKISVATNTLRVSNHRLTTGSSYLLYVGRVQFRKGLDKVLDAVKENGKKVVIVGEGEALASLKKQASNLQIEKLVSFKPSVYDEKKLLGLFSKAIGYVSPDHVGLGVVHSFSYGVPVITCKNRRHAPEFAYCSDDNSYLYDEDDDLVRTLDEAMGNRKGNLEKRRMAYRTFCDKLSYVNMIDAFEYHFNRLMI